MKWGKFVRERFLNLLTRALHVFSFLFERLNDLGDKGKIEKNRAESSS